MALVKVNILLDEISLGLLDASAAATGLSRSEFLRQFIVEYLGGTEIKALADRYEERARALRELLDDDRLRHPG